MLKIVLPLLVLLSSLSAAWALVALRPPTPSQSPHSEPPLVQTVRVTPQTLRLSVHSQGVATPRNEIDLVSQVAGQVIKLHPSLAAGGFFDAGEVLMAVDPRDYDYAIEAAEARIAEARRQVATEEAQAEQARSEWQALGEGHPTPLTLHEPQLAEARARLKAAQADLVNARLQRSRCEWRAPFAGRVRDKKVGLGQYIRPGDALARIYATDVVEVRLPLSKDQLAALDLPLGLRDSHPRTGPKVVLSTEFAATTRRWEGRIVRTEGALDEATGLLHVVAEVRDPYAVKDGQPPLMAGLFVQAEIEGKAQAGLFVLPPGAVNAAQEALWIDQDNRLHIHRLDIVQNEPGRIVAKGLPEAGQLIVSGVQTPVEGMAVRPQAAMPR